MNSLRIKVIFLSFLSLILFFVLIIKQKQTSNLEERITELNDVIDSHKYLFKFDQVKPIIVYNDDIDDDSLSFSVLFLANGLYMETSIVPFSIKTEDYFISENDNGITKIYTKRNEFLENDFSPLQVFFEDTFSGNRFEFYADWPVLTKSNGVNKIKEE